MTRFHKPFVEIAKVASVSIWLIVAGTGILLDQAQQNPWREMLVYSLIIPILLASFFYGRPGGLLVAFLSSLISGSIAIGRPDILQIPTVQHILFQIILFNIVALATSGLVERVNTAQIKLHQSHQLLERRVAELMTLQQVSMKLGSSLDPNEVLYAVADGIKALTDATDVRIFHYDAELDQLRPATVRSQYQHKALFDPLPRSDGLTARVARSGEPLIINDPAMHPLYKNSPNKWAPDDAIAGIPIRYAGRTLAVLNVGFFKHPHKFTEDDVRILNALAEQTALALENARLYQESLGLLKDLQSARDELAELNLELEGKVAKRTAELARRVDQLNLINRVGRDVTSLIYLNSLLPHIAGLIQATFGYYAVLIFLVGEDNVVRLSASATLEDIDLLKEGICFATNQGQGMVGHVIVTGEPIVAGDVSAEPRYYHDEHLPLTRSELALPLRVGDLVLGTLDLESAELEGFTTDDAQVLYTLADQIAVAIRNAQLYKAERDRRHWAESLEQAGRELSSCLDVRDVPERILEQLAAVVPYERGSVALQEGNTTRIIAQRGFPQDDRVSDLRMPIQEGDVFQQMTDTGRPVLIDDVTQTPGWQQVDWLPLHHSWMGVPMISRDQVIGMISLTRRDVGAFHPDETTVVSTFAVQAAIALENASLYDEIARFNESLELMVLDRTEELKKAYEALEKIDQTKTDFINIAAHELRTPLTLIRGYAALLDSTVESDPETRKLVAGIQTGERRLYEIVDSLLDLSKVSSEVLDISKEEVRLSDIIERVQSDFAATCQERKLTLTTGMDDLPPVQADPAWMYKIFHHLVMNAIKYTPDGGSIMMTGKLLSEVEEQAVEIVISDTGIGIDPDYHELIFEKFYQTGRVESHSSGRTKFKGGGPGLGLAIVKGIVSAHSGKIWVESEGYDEKRCPGSHFHVCLPVK